jgi:hypothetical protein
MNIHTAQTPAGLVVYLDNEPIPAEDTEFTEEELLSFNRLKLYKLNGERYAAAHHPDLIQVNYPVFSIEEI